MRKVDYSITEYKAGELIFEILIKSKIKERLDLSDNFVQTKAKKKLAFI